MTWKYICDKQLLDGLPKSIEIELLKCEICLQNKKTNIKFNNNSRRANDILEIIHTDVHGQIKQTGKIFCNFYR